MQTFDITIIGAGIIGLSTAYKLIENHPGLKICILEKENSHSAHQSGHNSGVMHSGIYYAPGSLKAVNCIKGYKMLIEFCDKHEIKYEICGKLILATEEKESEALIKLYDRGIQNNLDGLKIIDGKEIKEIEPYAFGLSAIHVPQTGITDFRQVSGKIAALIASKGVKIFYGQKVVKFASTEKSSLKISTNTDNDFISKFLVGCAGLHSDHIAQLIFGKINFRIIPFRGEYYRLRNQSARYVRNLIYPVPDPQFPFLGLHFTRRISGDIEVGPNAVFAFKKEGYKKSDVNIKELFNALSYEGFHKIAARYWKTGLYEIYRSLSKKEFVKSLQKLIPDIKENDIEKFGSGVRAQACDNEGNLIDDFYFMENENSVIVCNAPSPAATSCFSVGETIAEKIIEKLNSEN